MDESGEVEPALSTEFPSSWAGGQSSEFGTELRGIDTAVSVDVLGEPAERFLIVRDGGFLVVGFAECGDDDGYGEA